MEANLRIWYPAACPPAYVEEHAEHYAVEFRNGCRMAARSALPRAVATTRSELRTGKAARILDAAEDLFLKRGFKGVTMADVAEKARVGKGTICGLFLHDVPAWAISSGCSLRTRLSRFSSSARWL